MTKRLSDTIKLEIKEKLKTKQPWLSIANEYHISQMTISRIAGKSKSRNSILERFNAFESVMNYFNDQLIKTNELLAKQIESLKDEIKDLKEDIKYQAGELNDLAVEMGPIIDRFNG
jgi:seryl-tRNA synthetase